MNALPGAETSLNKRRGKVCVERVNSDSAFTLFYFECFPELLIGHLADSPACKLAIVNNSATSEFFRSVPRFIRLITNLRSPGNPAFFRRVSLQTLIGPSDCFASIDADRATLNSSPRPSDSCIGIARDKGLTIWRFFRERCFAQA